MVLMLRAMILLFSVLSTKGGKTSRYEVAMVNLHMEINFNVYGPNSKRHKDLFSIIISGIKERIVQLQVGREYQNISDVSHALATKAKSLDMDDWK